MRQLYPLLSAGLLSILLFTACNKDDKKELRTCRLDAVDYRTPGIHSRYAFSYESSLNSRAVMVTRNTDSLNGEKSSASTQLTYFGTSAVAIHRMADSLFASHDSLVFDGDGRLLTRISYRNASGSSATATSYAYRSGSQLLQTVERDLGTNAILHTTNYTYSNGNISATDSAQYSYYTDRSFQNGDYWMLMQMLQDGLTTIYNNNLLQSIQRSSGIVNLFYNFDGEGRITRINGSGGGPDFSYDVSQYCY